MQYVQILHIADSGKPIKFCRLYVITRRVKPKLMQGEVLEGM